MRVILFLAKSFDDEGHAGDSVKRRVCANRSSRPPVQSCRRNRLPASTPVRTRRTAVWGIGD